MQALRLFRKASLVSVLAFTVLAPVGLAAAQPPVARTKPVIDQQIAAQARHSRQQHAKASHSTTRGCANTRRLWWVREIVLFAKRTLKRLDLTSRTLVALVEPGSCFAGFLAEVLFAADRSYMLDGTLDDDTSAPATLALSPSNFGGLPMSNGLSRLATRFYGDPAAVARLRALVGKPLDAAAARAQPVSSRLRPTKSTGATKSACSLEERASFSPDALTAMEANLRFVGPETLETKIFARLSAWQNWVFQRPNAVGDEGALKRYGTGQRPRYDKTRI